MNKNNNETFNVYNLVIQKELLQKYLQKKINKKVKNIFDLKELNTRTQNELLKVFNEMIKAKKYFKYCSSLLININPGPKNINEYLNLEKYYSNTKNIEINNNNNKIEPHLYFFIEQIYNIMKIKKADQCINLLGLIGSGKTFNIIHILEYFSIFHSEKNIETFEILHKSLQLIHIFGSIYRENNIESTACGILLRLGFDENKFNLCDFDIESKILDFTLPFSENGRSFNILHCFIEGSNSELKRIFEINRNGFNFLKKFNNNFDEKTKERFKLNDLEIWNKLFNLLNYFEFEKNEIIDILHCLSFIINLNEANVEKIKIKKKEFFHINSELLYKKLSKNLLININILKYLFGNFSTLEKIKNFIISLIKQTYFILFDFILNKIKEKLLKFFPKKNNNKNNKNNNKIYYINIIDFPGEIKDKNLGGFTTNIANECLNMYASTNYHKIVEKLIKEGINLNRFLPLQCYYCIKSCFVEKGLLENINNNKIDFNEFKKNSLIKKYFLKSIKFHNSKFHLFTYFFSNINVDYNLETLFQETKSFLFNNNIYKIFENSKNLVIQKCYKNLLLNECKDFYSFYTKTLKFFFDKIQHIQQPFVIYCLHSKNSYKIFFNNNNNNNYSYNITENNNNFNKKKSFYNEIPKQITINIINNSLILPILNWDWYGFKEWMEFSELNREFSEFENYKDKIIKIHNKKYKNKPPLTNINFKEMNNKNISKFIMNILARENDYLIGKNFVIMKEGTLNRMKIYLNSMINTINEIKPNKNNNNNKNKIKNNKKNIKNKNKNIKINLYKIKNDINSKEDLLSNQCIIKILSNNKIINDKTPISNLKAIRYNLYEILNHKENINITTLDNSAINNSITNNNPNTTNYENLDTNESIEKEFQNFAKNKNVCKNIDQITYTKIKNLFDIKKNKNYNIFDYSDKNDVIIKLQSVIRGFLSRNYYKKIEFVNSQIKIIQSFYKMFVVKNKFKNFLKCYKKIVLIQKVYKNRFFILNKNAYKIQKYWKEYLNKKKRKEYLNKIIERKNNLIKGDFLDLNNNFDNEILLNDNNNNINNENNNNNNNFNINDLLNFVNKENNKNNQKKISNKNIYNNIHKINKKFYDNSQIQQSNFYNYQKYNNLNFLNLNENNNKKYKINDITNLILNEKDPKKIIEYILSNKKFLFEKFDYSNYLYKTKLDKNNKKLNNNNNNIPVQERLLQYGLNKKNKESLSILKKENEIMENNTYHPFIDKNSIFYKTISNKYPNDFLKRMEYYKLYKDRNIENLRNKFNNDYYDFKVKTNQSSLNILKFKNDGKLKNVYERLYNENDLIEKKNNNNNNDNNENEEFYNNSRQQKNNLNEINSHNYNSNKSNNNEYEKYQNIIKEIDKKKKIKYDNNEAFERLYKNDYKPHKSSENENNNEQIDDNNEKNEKEEDFDLWPVNEKNFPAN